MVAAARAEAENRRTPAGRAETLRRAIKLAIDESLAKGITTFEDAGSPFATVDVLKKMADKHELRMRIWMMLRAPNEHWRRSWIGTASSARAAISSPCAPSSARSTARWARAAHGCWSL